MTVLEPPVPLDAALGSDDDGAVDGTTATDADARHQRIARDSLLLTASYGATALVGVAFWTLAARTIPAERLGIETAIISAFTAAATFAAGGVANAFLALLPIARRMRGNLLRLGYLTTLTTALLFGIVAGVLTDLLLPDVGSAVWTIGGVTAAAVLWSVFILQDSVLTALGKPQWLLAENLPVNAAKLALLPVFAAVVSAGAKPVVLAMLVPAAAAVAVVNAILIPRLVRSTADHREPSDASVTPAAYRHTFGLFVARDGTANGLNLGLVMIIPFAVTATAGAVQGAVFALCLQVSSALDLVTAGVGVSLTTNVASDHASGAAAAVRMWRRLVVLVAALSVLVIAGSPVLLWLFGPTYLEHNGVLVIVVLAAGAILRTPFEVWTALLRAQRRTGTLLGWTTVNSTVLLAIVIALGAPYGALGAAIGVSAAALLTAAVGWRGLAHDLRSGGGASADDVVTAAAAEATVQASVQT